MAKKLTESQWQDVIRKAVVDNVTPYVLSKEYGVPASTIRSRLKSAQIAQVEPLSNQLVSVRREIGKLDNFAQSLIESRSNRLLILSDDYLDMAAIGIKTGKRLFAIAAMQVDKIDVDNPLESMEAIQSINVLQKTALDSKSPANDLRDSIGKVLSSSDEIQYCKSIMSEKNANDIIAKYERINNAK